MKPVFFLSRKDFEQKSTCWNFTSFLIIFGFWAEANLSLANIFRPEFQNCLSFVQLTFKRKSFWWNVNTFGQYLHFMQKIYCSRNFIRRSVKLLFPCQEQLYAKCSFPWKTYNFSINFCFEPKKLRFLLKSFQQSCQTCYVWCPRNTPRKNLFTEKITISFEFFRILTQQKSRLEENCFSRAVKIAFFVFKKILSGKINWKKEKLLFSCPANISRKNYSGEKQTFLSIFWNFEQKKDRILANSFQHSCHVCVSRVQQTLWGKTNLLKSVQNCSSLWALSRRTFYSQEKT